MWLCRTHSLQGGSNADIAFLIYRGFGLQHVGWQMGYLGQILHSGIPNTSLDDFIKPPDLAERRRRRDPGVCVQLLEQPPMCPTCPQQAVPAHGHRARHGDGGAGGDTATHGGDVPLGVTRSLCPPQAPGRAEGEGRMVGVFISSPVCQFGIFLG